MLFSHFGTALRQYWAVPIVVSVTGAVLLGIVAWRQQPEYRADLRLSVAFEASQKRAAQGRKTPQPKSAEPVDPRLIQSRVRTYTQRVASRRVVDAVISRQRLPYEPDELAGRVRASTPLDTRFIDVSVRDSDARRAVRIANAIVDELQAMAAREAAATSATAAAPVISVVRRPTVVGPAPRPWFGFLAGGLIGGFVMGVGLAALRVESARHATGGAGRVPWGPWRRRGLPQRDHQQLAGGTLGAPEPGGTAGVGL